MDKYAEIRQKSEKKKKLEKFTSCLRKKKKIHEILQPIRGKYPEIHLLFAGKKAKSFASKLMRKIQNSPIVHEKVLQNPSISCRKYAKFNSQLCEKNWKICPSAEGKYHEFLE